MAIVTRDGNNEKVREKLELCRNAGLRIVEDFVSGVARAENDGVAVLICTRKGDNQWQLDYNDDFWDEVGADS